MGQYVSNKEKLNKQIANLDLFQHKLHPVHTEEPYLSELNSGYY